MQQFRYIGYWNNSQNQYPEFPLPLENTATDEEVKAALLLLDKIEKSPKTLKKAYRGWSTCRICQKSVGSEEFEVCVRNKKKDIVLRIAIPVGYRHYIETHRVKPDLESLELAAQHC